MRIEAAFVASLTVACVTAPARDARVTVGPEGGVVETSRVRVEVPPGAVDAPVEIRVTELGVAAPSGWRACSPVFRFEPEGQTFAHPISVGIVDRDGCMPAAIAWSSAGSAPELVASVIAGDVVWGEVSHFSTGFVAALEDTDAGPPDAAMEGDAEPADGGVAASDAADSGCTAPAGGSLFTLHRLDTPLALDLVIDATTVPRETMAYFATQLESLAAALRVRGVDHRLILEDAAPDVVVPEPLASDAAHFVRVSESGASSWREVARPLAMTQLLVLSLEEPFPLVASDEQWREYERAYHWESTLFTMCAPRVAGDPLGAACSGPHGAGITACRASPLTAQSTGGDWGSICDADWGPSLDRIALVARRAVAATVRYAAPPELDLRCLPAARIEIRDSTATPLLRRDLDARPGIDTDVAPACRSIALAGQSARAWYFDDDTQRTSIVLCGRPPAITIEDTLTLAVLGL